MRRDVGPRAVIDSDDDVQLFPGARVQLRDRL